MSSPSDEELLAQATAGNSDALAQLLERHGSLLRGSIAGEIPRRWRAVLSADDVAQETYIDAFLDISRFHPSAATSFLGWLLTLARRNLLDALRMLEAEKRGRHRRRVQSRPPHESLLALYEYVGGARSTPSRHAARAEALEALRHAIDRLPAAYRRVVQLYDLEGRSSAEVAVQLGLSRGAMFMVRCRAHRHLRQYLGTASLYLSDTA